MTLCQVLSISIGDLFAAPETHLTKQNEGPRISLGGEGIVERLLTARSERRVQIIQAVIEPRGAASPSSTPWTATSTSCMWSRAASA